jgi:hypothetical protein
MLTTNFNSRLYPGKIGGIFFDEGMNTCGDNDRTAELYRYLSENTKRKHTRAFTVLNPGTIVPECYRERSVSL